MNLLKLKNIYQNITKYKSLIVSIFVVLSILRTVLWCSLWGVNILAFSSLTDIFTSFANYISSIIVFIIYVIFCYIFDFTSVKNESKRVLLRLFVCLILGFTFFNVINILAKPFTFWEYVFGILPAFPIIWGNKAVMKIAVLLLLLAASFISPYLEYHAIINKSNKSDSAGVRIELSEEDKGNLRDSVWISNNINHIRINGYNPVDYYDRRARYDNISFEYNNAIIDTNTEQYFLIEHTLSYFFVYDFGNKQTLIIPKDDCKNIIVKNAHKK